MLLDIKLKKFKNATFFKNVNFQRNLKKNLNQSETPSEKKSETSESIEEICEQNFLSSKLYP